jgi:hypothetical protein
MLGRHVYRVSPTPQGAGEEGWQVKKEGEAGPRGRFSSRDAAFEAACKFAAGDEPSKVTVENRDGTLAEERSFGVDPGQQPGR